MLRWLGGKPCSFSRFYSTVIINLTCAHSLIGFFGAGVVLVVCIVPTNPGPSSETGTFVSSFICSFFVKDKKFYVPIYVPHLTQGEHLLSHPTLLFYQHFSHPRSCHHLQKQQFSARFANILCSFLHTCQDPDQTFSSQQSSFAWAFFFIFFAAPCTNSAWFDPAQNLLSSYHLKKI